MRLFTALDPGAAARAEFARVQAEARGRVGCRRWQDPLQAHLTLHFLGEVDPARLPALEAAFADACAARAPFELALGAWGGFPSRRNARVLWLGVEGDREALLHLEAGLRAPLAAWGLLAEPDRPYAPHLTVGREPAGRVPWEALSPPAPSPWAVSALVLYRSELTPVGPHYTALGRYALGG